MHSNRYKISLTIIFILIFLSSLVAASQKFKNKYYGRSYALVVGINKYPATAWQNLDNAQKGAAAFKSMLENHGFNVTTLYDEQATRANILAKINEITSRAHKEDRFLFYFAGHGQKKKTQGFLVPHDGHNTEFNSYIPLRNIIQTAKRVDAKHQLYVMDACYAGFIKTRGGASRTSKKDPKYLQIVTSVISRKAITAGAKNQEVLDSGGPGGHSPFTGHFLQAIQKGKADGNGDGFVTLSEIHNYLLPNATSDYSQPAQTSLPGDDDGLFVFISEIGATQKFNQIKTGGKKRKKTKKGIENPATKDAKKEKYSETLTAADWLDKGDETVDVNYAIECYTNAIKLYPNFNEAYFNRAIAYEDLADSELDELPVNEALPERMRKLFLLAIKDYQKVLELDPTDTDCHFNLGALYFELERYDQALSAFNNALKYDPEDTYAYTYRGDVYLAQQKDDKAFADYKKAIQIDPEDGYLFYDRGEAYLSLGQFTNAIRDFNEAIKRISDEPDFYDARAEAYEEVGKLQNAEADRKKADTLYDQEEQLDSGEYDEQ